MGTVGRFNLILERLMVRIHGLLYLFKDRLKRPLIEARPHSGRWMVWVWAILLLSCAVASAAIPKYINYQGRLTDSDGNPVANGTYTVTFRLYSAQTGGTALWTEEQSVSVASGVFNTALGTETSLSGLAFDTEYWLSVQVGSDTEMSPRQRLTSAGYALNADNVDNLTSSQFLRSDADDSASGQVTLTYPGSALVVAPSAAPTSGSKLVDVQDSTGSSVAYIDDDGDLAGGNLILQGHSDPMIYFGSEASPVATIIIDASTGAMTYNKDLTVSGDQTIVGTTTYEGALDVEGNFTVSAGNTVSLPEGQIDSTEIADATIAGGDLATDIAISTSGAISSSSTSGVTASGGDLTGKNLVLSGGSDALIYFGSKDSPTSTIIFDATTGDLTFNKNLTVQGDQTIQGETLYEDALTVAGDFTVNAGNTVSLPTGQIDSTEIEDGSITADDLGTDSVDADEIAASAVGTDEIDNGAITADDLGTDSVAADEIASGAVGTDEIDDQSIAGGDLATDIAISTSGAVSSSSASGITASGGDLTGQNLVLIGGSDALIYFGSKSAPTATVTFDSTTGDVTFNKEITATALNTATGSPAVLNFGSGAQRTSLIYDPDTEEIRFSRGVFAHDFRNLVKNGSFEAFSALEEFHDYDLDYATDTNVYDTTAGFQGGWESFAPDEWTYVNQANGGGGKVFQQAPTYFKYDFDSDDISSTTYAQDFAEGRSAVRLVADGSNPAIITQELEGLKPSTLYTVGVKMRVDSGGSAVVDIEGEDTSTSTAINDPDGISATEAKEIVVDSLSGFPNYGVLIIGSEYISYAGLDTATNKFVRLARGIENTTASTHNDGATVTVAPFKALTTSSHTSYTKFKGNFHTDNKASSVTIKLKSTATGGEAAYFDTVQVVAGGTVPEYGPNYMVDTGDQTMYGSLRVGRASDEKGGILSVDKFVRTRGIELFTDDPGLSGAMGGGGATQGNTGIYPPGPGWNNTENQQPTVQLFTTGQYPTTSPSHRDYKVQVTDATNNQFDWWYMDSTTNWTYTTGGSDLAMTTNTNGTELASGEGVYVYFSSLATDVTGDTWWFSASNEEAYGGYDTYADTVSYVSGESRIYKEADFSSPYYGKLMFEDGSVKVSLEELADSVSVDTSGYIGEPYPYGNNSGGLTMFTSGNYSGADSRTYYVKISSEGTYDGSSDGFSWRRSTEAWDAHAEQTVSGSPVALENNIAVSFSENWDWGDSYYTAGNATNPDTWSFSVSPGSTAAGQVDSLQGKTGAVTLQEGGGISIGTGGEQIITISASGGVASGMESETTSESFTLDSDSTGTLDQDLHIYFEDDENATAHSLSWDDGADTFLFDDDLSVSGNVGIGTTGPGAKLEIDGGDLILTGTATNHLILPLNNDAATPTLAFGDGDSGFYESGDDSMYVTLGGQFMGAFHSQGIVGGQIATDYGLLSVNKATATVPGLSFLNDVDTGVGKAGDNILSLIAGGTNGLNVISSGNVGIGTTNPSEELEVAGDVKLSGRILQGSLGDLSEMMSLASCILNPANVPLDEPQVLAKGKNEGPVVLSSQQERAQYLLERPEAGDVVIIDVDGGVRRSYASLATNTAGIISTNPAQILRDGLENAVPVALNGVVPCKVTTENGAITPGDLLVTSSTPGHAMKAKDNPPAGTVIGKALARLDEEAGVVEVLVMMK